MDLSETPPFRPPSKVGAALALGLLVGVAFYVVAQLVDKSYGPALFATPFFVGVTMGVVAPQAPYRLGLLGTILLLGLSVLTLREGVVCVLFSLPLLMPLSLLGSFVGRFLVRFVHSERKRRSALHGILALGLLWHLVEAAYDDPQRHPEHAAEAALFFPAAPEAVFTALTRSDVVLRDDWPWFLRIGLPTPRRMSIHNPGPQAELRFDIGQGTAFGSVTAWRTNRELAYRIDRFEIDDLPFHITRLGRSPNYGFRPERVEDWLSITSVKYSLFPSASGTLLTRRVLWRRHLAPGFYFGWLQQTIMEHGQRRLLSLLRETVLSTGGEVRRDAQAVAESRNLTP
ncbi:MAG TPA: hypothetical protein VG937_18570 [Polyangiaceae bacterium]|nr:hypothetical protein [Polyangiaceae bacterium]